MISAQFNAQTRNLKYEYFPFHVIRFNPQT